MTKPNAVEPVARSPIAEPRRTGLFLVKTEAPVEKRIIPQVSARKSRSVGLWTLAGAALAAPLLWWAHELIGRIRFR